jgi:hypothetical protein
LADFKYANDSVLLVDRAAFDACNSTQPVASFADGATTFRLNRTGFFCFISVMVHSALPAAAAPQQPGHGGHPEQHGPPGASSAGVDVVAAAVAIVNLVLMIQ